MHTFWCILFKLGMHITCDEFYILKKVKVIGSKVKVTEVMVAAGGIVLREHILFKSGFSGWPRDYVEPNCFVGYWVNGQSHKC